MKNFVTGLALSATVASAQPSYCANFQRFCDVMTQYGYDWEAHMVPVPDSIYIMTTFRILGKQGNGPAGPAVLVQHGEYQDGTMWMTNQTGKPF